MVKRPRNPGRQQPFVQGTVLTERGKTRILPGDEKIDLEEMSKHGTPSFVTHDVADILSGKKHISDVTKNEFAIPTKIGTKRALDKKRLPGESDSQLLDRLMADSRAPLRDTVAGVRLKHDIRKAERAACQALVDEMFPRGHSCREAAMELFETILPLEQDQRRVILEGLIDETGLVAEENVGQAISIDRFDQFLIRPFPKVRPTEPKFVDNYNIAIEEVRSLSTNIVQQSVRESVYHKCLQAIKDGTILYPIPDVNQQKHFIIMPLAPKIFLLQHDWAQAFRGAQDFDEGGLVELPFPEVVFETRLSGRRTIVMLMQSSGQIMMAVLIETSVAWAFVAYYTFHQEDWTTEPIPDDTASAIISRFVREQIRAVNILLESEVAETEVVRAPYKLNERRTKAGKLPIYDFHLVSLAARRRYALRSPEPGEIEEDYTRRRLHFVRGHWRRYANHRTKVKWHLRGDPDLGFVDKEYRL